MAYDTDEKGYDSGNEYIDFELIPEKQIPALIEMETRLFGDAFSPDEYMRCVRYWICEGDGYAIGCLVVALNSGIWKYGKSEPPREDGSMFIMSVGLEESFRGRGIMYVINDQILKIAREHRQTQIVSCCAADNEASFKVHQRFMDDATEMIPEFYPGDPPRTAYVFRKDVK